MFLSGKQYGSLSDLSFSVTTNNLHLSYPDLQYQNMCSTCPSKCYPGKPCASHSKTFSVDYNSYAGPSASIELPTDATPLLAPINDTNSLSLPVTISCYSTATFTFAGWIQNINETDTATVGLQLQFVNNYTVGVSTGVVNFPITSISAGEYGSITAVQNVTLPPGGYTVYLAIYNISGVATTIFMAGTLSYVVVKQ
jgi:hypothetical protein